MFSLLKGIIFFIASQFSSRTIIQKREERRANEERRKSYEWKEGSDERFMGRDACLVSKKKKKIFLNTREKMKNMRRERGR